MSTRKFCDRLAEARQQQALSVAQLSKLIAVTPETYRRWENGRSEPRANKLLTLAGLLNVSPSWLLNGERQAQDELSDEARFMRIREQISALETLQAQVLKSYTALNQEVEQLAAQLDPS